MPLLRHLFIITALALTWTSADARAQPTADALARAKVHFEAGTRHYDIGAYDEAAREFERAYELSEHPELLYNVYTSLERAGRHGEAADALSEYLERGEIEPSQRPALEARLSALRARAEREAPPREPDHDEAQDDAASDEPESAEAERKLPKLAIASYYTAGGMAAVFGTFAGLALAEYRSLEDRCGERCTSSEVKKLRALNATADVALAVGVAALTTALVSTFVGRRESPKVDVSFFADRESRGLVLRSRF